MEQASVTDIFLHIWPARARRGRELTLDMDLALTMMASAAEIDPEN